MLKPSDILNPFLFGCYTKGDSEAKTILDEWLEKQPTEEEYLQRVFSHILYKHLESDAFYTLTAIIKMQMEQIHELLDKCKNIIKNEEL